MKHASVDRAKRVSNSCRNHGSCPYCERSRTMAEHKQNAELASLGFNPHTRSDFLMARHFDAHYDVQYRDGQDRG